MTGTVSNMSTMVDSLLCYFKADSDKLSFSSAPFKLTSIKEYLFSTYGRMADSKGLHLDVNVHDDTVLAGDEQCIQLILGNLVSNAVKFTETGKITVDMMYEGNILSLSVRDEGDGISDEDKQRIFLRAFHPALQCCGTGRLRPRPLHRQHYCTEDGRHHRGLRQW